MQRIMLVDDDFGVLSSLRRCLQQMPTKPADGGLRLEIFEQPELALNRAQECEFDLVIADWRMPVMDGLAFLTRLLPLQPSIARLIMSADDRFRQQAESMRQLKIFHFVSKPWRPEILQALVRLALDSRPATRTPFRPQRRPVDVQFQQFAPDAPLSPPFAPPFRLRGLDGRPM